MTSLYRLPRFLVLFVIVAVYFIVFASPVSALSEAQRKALDGGIYYFNVEECGTGSRQSVSLPAQTTGKVYMIGDSITAGAKTQLESAITGKGFSPVVIDGKSSRRLSSGTSDGLDGLDTLEQSKDQFKDASVVIIALGTNGGASPENIKKAINAIKGVNPAATIYWVNVGVTRSDIPQDTINKNIQDNTSEGYSVIDWATQVKAHPDYLGDQVHPVGPGIQAFADLVANGLRGGNAPSPKNNCQCTLSSTNLIGSDNAEKVWNFFIGKGYSAEIVAGMLGNMQAESGVNPRRVEGTPTPSGDSDTPGSNGYGIVQWTPGTKILPSAEKAGMPPSDLGFQVQLLYAQLEGNTEFAVGINEKAAGDALKTAKTVEEATEIFLDKYERAGVRRLDERIQFAQDMFARFGSLVGGSSSGTIGCASLSNGQIVGNYSLPIDKKWYDENNQIFSQPHHGNPDDPAVDISVPIGTPVYSMTAGKVIVAPTGGDCGIGVTIQSESGGHWVYCHGLDGGSIPGAKQGDTVQPGQLIMHSASTGRSTGPHLHINITEGGQRRCPQPLLVGIAKGSPPDINTIGSTGCTNGL